MRGEELAQCRDELCMLSRGCCCCWRGGWDRSLSVRNATLRDIQGICRMFGGSERDALRVLSMRWQFVKVFACVFNGVADWQATVV